MNQTEGFLPKAPLSGYYFLFNPGNTLYEEDDVQCGC